MTVLNEVALGLEIALFVVFVVLVSATLFVDRREARRTARRRTQPKPGRPRVV
jgi:hypothetical protein